MTELELGFGKSPRRRTVYVNRIHEDCLWYFWNGLENKHEPISENDLFCILEEVRVGAIDFKGSQVEKLELHVKAEAKYRLVAGLDTAVSKSLLRSLLHPGLDFSKPIAIVVKPGDEASVIFGAVYQDLPAGDLPPVETVDDILAAIAAINDRLGKSQSVEATAIEWLKTDMKATILANLGEVPASPADPVRPTIDEKTAITLYKEATSIGWLKADLKAMVSAELGISSMNDLPIDLVDEYRRLISDASTKASYSSRGVGGNA